MLGGKRRRKSGGAFASLVSQKRYAQQKQTSIMPRRHIDESKFNPIAIITSTVKITEKCAKVKALFLPMGEEFLNEKTPNISFIYPEEGDETQDTSGEVKPIGFRYIPTYSFADIKEKGEDVMREAYPILDSHHLMLYWGMEYQIFITKEFVPDKPYCLVRLIDFSVRAKIDRMITSRLSFFVGASAIKTDDKAYLSQVDLMRVMYSNNIIVKELPHVSTFDDVLEEKVAIAAIMNTENEDAKDEFWEAYNEAHSYTSKVGPCKTGPFYFHMCTDPKDSLIYEREDFGLPALCDDKGRKFFLSILDSGVHEDEMPKYFSSQRDSVEKCGWRFYTNFTHARVKMAAWNTEEAKLEDSDLYLAQSHAIYFVMLNDVAKTMGFPEAMNSYKNMVSKYWPFFSFGIAADISAKRTVSRPERHLLDAEDKEADTSTGEVVTSAYSMFVHDVFGPVREFFVNAGIPISTELAEVLLKSTADTGSMYSSIKDLPSMGKNRKVACLSELTLEEAKKELSHAHAVVALLQFQTGDKVSSSLFKALKALNPWTEQHVEVGTKIISAIYDLQDVCETNELAPHEADPDVLDEDHTLGWEVLHQLLYYDEAKWDEKFRDAEWIIEPLVYAIYNDDCYSKEQQSFVKYVINNDA